MSRTTDPVPAPPFTMTDTNQLSSSLSDQLEVQKFMSQDGVNSTADGNGSTLDFTNATPRQEQRDSVIQASQGLTSDLHQPDKWVEDTTNTARLQVVDENQTFT